MQNIVEYYAKKVDFTVAAGLPGPECLYICCQLSDKVRSLIWNALPQDLPDKDKKIEMLKIMYERDFTKEKFEIFLNRYKEYLDSLE